LDFSDKKDEDQFWQVLQEKNPSLILLSSFIFWLKHKFWLKPLAQGRVPLGGRAGRPGLGRA
jgi:hypothetical protein